MNSQESYRDLLEHAEPEEGLISSNIWCIRSDKEAMENDSDGEYCPLFDEALCLASRNIVDKDVRDESKEPKEVSLRDKALSKPEEDQPQEDRNCAKLSIIIAKQPSVSTAAVQTSSKPYMELKNANITLDLKENSSLLQVDELDEFSGIKNPKTQVQKLSKLVWRNDVFNKTILRTLKKSFTSNFLELTGLLKKIKSKKERRKHSYDAIKQYVLHEFQGESSLVYDIIKKTFETQKHKSLEDKDVLNELVHYVGNILLPEYWSHTRSSSKCKSDTALFFKCIYKYSNISFMKLHQCPIIACLFKVFMTKGYFLEMTKTDSSLKRDPEKYIKRANEILRCFEANDEL